MYYESYDRPHFGLVGMLTPMVKRLLLANLGVFLLQHLVALQYNASLTTYFGLTPDLVVSRFMIWQLVTYMFLHGGWMHLLFNMFVLWMFGTEIERQWGGKELLFYYLITGVGAGIFNILFNLFTPYSGIPTIGASGAVYGILLAFGLMFPNRYIYLYFFFPVKAKYLVMIAALLTFMSAISYNPDGIAHFAHLGGMIVGFVYLKADWRLHSFVEWFQERKTKRHIYNIERHRRDIANFREELDRILDRINEVGYENLTKDEKKVLRKASMFLSKESDE